MLKTRLWVVMAALSLMLAAAWSCATAKDAPRVDKETLKGWLADPQVLIIDVRVGKDWTDSTKKIKGAVRQEPKEAKTWAAKLPKDKKIVLYCS